MSDITQTATVDLRVNGNNAENRLKQLEQQALNFKDAMSQAAKAGDKVSYEKWNRELKRTQKEIKTCKTEMANVDDVIKRMDRATLKELKSSLRVLEKQWEKMERGSEAWNSHAEKIKALKQEIQEVKSELDLTETWKDKIDDFISSWGDYIAGAVGSIAGIVMAARSAVSAYAEMEQEMANVRKYTGMTAEEVETLNEAFKNMDTRTTRDELNKLAQEAGRLGKTSVEDVLGFVRAADKINVALDDLGEGATLTLSKLTDIFGDEKRLGTERSLLAVGSVINELSQNCSASAPYIAEFTSRLGGVGSQAKMTVQQLMGIAAVLDSQGISCEKSATALSQVITRLYAEPAKYAKAAGLNVEKFTQMLKEDANAALLEFLNALNQAGGMDKLAPMFKELGESGSGAVSALSTLAKNIDQVRMQQEVANQAFSEATSINQEYDVQNNTVQAGLDKAKKSFMELAVELGERLKPAMQYTISSTSTIMKLLLGTINFVRENIGLVVTATAAIAAYAVVVNLSAIKTKLLAAETIIVNAVMTAQRAVVLLSSAAMALFSGNVEKARRVFILFSNTLKASPWGLLIAGATAVIGVLINLINKTIEARKEEARLAEERKQHYEELRDISARTADFADKEINSLKRLYKVATDDCRAKEDRLKAAQQILDKYPEFFQGVNAEMIMIGNASKAYDNLTRSILDNARARAAAEKILENEKALIELEEKMEKKRKDVNAAEGLVVKKNRELEEFNNMYGNNRNSGDLRGLSIPLKKGLIEAQDALALANKEYAELEEQWCDIIDANYALKEKYRVTDDMLDRGDNNTTLPDLGGIYTGKTGLPDKDLEKTEKERKEAEQKAKKALEEDLKDEKKAYEDAMAQELERYNREEISYTDYLERKYALDLDYIEKQKKVLEQHKLVESEEYARLCKQKEEIEMKSLENIKKNKFKELDKIHTEESTKNRAAYYAGEQDYQLYLAKQELLDAKLVNDKLAILSEGNYKESGDYAQLLEQKEDLYEKHLDRISKLTSMAMEKRHAEAMQDIELDYNDPKSAIFNNQKARYQAELVEQYRYLTAMRDMYLKGSDEWVKYQTQIDDLLAKDKLRKQEEMAAALLEHSERYRQLDREQREQAEKTILDELHAKGLISEEEYQKALRDIRRKYRKEKRESERDDWDKAREDISDFGGSLNSEIFNLSMALDRLFDSKNGENFWENIAKAAESAFAVMSALTSQFTSYFSAEKDVEIAKINKYYDVQIEKAGKNTKKVQKLEAEKEKKIAELKTKYNSRAMKVELAQALAQTAVNALLGYQAGLKFPFPANTVMPGVLAGLAVAQGMLQVATIKKQHEAEAQGYSRGGFTKPGRVDEPAGVVHAGEWVASQALVNSPRTRPVIEALERAQRENRISTFALGADAPVAATVSMGAPTSIQDRMMSEVVYTLSELQKEVRRLHQRLDEPIVAHTTVTGDYGIKKAMDDYNRMINNKSRK